MQQGRRTNDRRRRVLYSAQQADHASATKTSRREAEKLREARCPQTAYGSRVHRRIRGRWFSLVPIRRRSMILVAGCLGILATTLCIAHYAAISLPSLSTQPTIARPLRLDRPDSFGRWCMVAMLCVTAGIALMTYQLRRYRNDDFRGHYRLWRLVVVVTILASVNSLVSMLEWGGAILDAGFGKRVALAGSDWIRLVVTFGGAVLALRMVAEIRRCRTALVMLLVSCVMFAIPEAVKWNILKVESIGYWTMATTAPMLGCTSLLIAMLAYLRMLYREVKQVEEGSLMDRFHQLRLNLFQTREAETDENPSGEHSDATPKRGWRPQGTPDANGKSKEKRQRKAPVDADDRDTEPDGDAVKDDNESSSKVVPGMKRRWFGLRKAKPAATKSETDARTKTQASQSPKDDSKKKRQRSSLRLKPKSTTGDHGNTSNHPNVASASKQASGGQARKGLLGWRRKKDTIASESADQTNSSKPRPTNEQVRERTEHEGSEEQSVDTDTIDWTSMNKAERRRLRKQLKRQNKAA